ncbi:carbohydrate kinase family protein [Rhizobium mayense]|uniref:Carbohydrate kinase family protein n=1 Tax=Rhizobium mayense TaxID=1312184 RepID=A0ABT7K7F9_9HYPH|nr:carbohydrate kinase family protein [Rhizobium mayense]MDL2403084.1 carbohydrate kinase family protein [Rhizobium mayense]
MQDIAFAYFHPLSDPFIEPRPGAIKQCQPIEVDGRSVLRFGMLEGTARVRGERVVYDPQSPRSPEPFSVNGSTARDLALVMNREEFQAYSRNDDIRDGAYRLLASKGADVIVVKQGIHGALVFANGMPPSEIPIYRSAKTFKIGTGDVFSGVFAHYWAFASYSPQEAADKASRAVSVYCDNPTDPIDESTLPMAHPVSLRHEMIEVFGIGNTLGRRYTLQEAAFCIRKLGLEARIIEDPMIIEETMMTGETSKAVLVIADGLSDETLSHLLAKRTSGVILDEEGRPRLSSRARGGVGNDFASAIYQVCTDARKLN